MDIQELKALAEAADEGEAWELDEYDVLSCSKGVIAEVCGIGRRMSSQLGQYLKAVHPKQVLSLIAEVEASRREHEWTVINESRTNLPIRWDYLLEYMGAGDQPFYAVGYWNRLTNSWIVNGEVLEGLDVKRWRKLPKG